MIWFFDPEYGQYGPLIWALNDTSLFEWVLSHSDMRHQTRMPGSGPLVHCIDHPHHGCPADKLGQEWLQDLFTFYADDALVQADIRSVQDLQRALSGVQNIINNFNG